MARQRASLLAQRGAAAVIGVSRSVSEVGGAFACVSGPPCTCGALRFVAHAQVWHFSGRAGELRAMLTKWSVVGWLQSVQKRLKALARARSCQRTEMLVEALAAAERQRAMSECWRLARLIAGVGAGPMGRMRTPFSASAPTIPEWDAHLAQDGPAGGMLAAPVDGRAPPSEAFVPPLANDVAEALGADQEIVRVIRRAPNRKSPGLRDVPAEIWKLACAEREVMHRRAGVGSSHHVVYSGIARRLTHMFAVMLSTGEAPSFFNDGMAWQIAKNNGKPKCAGIRLVHGLPVLTKCFYRYVWQDVVRRDAIEDPPYYAFGGVRGRRREQAIVVQQSMARRSRHLRRSHAVMYHDVANAFPSVSYPAIADTIDGAFGGNKDKLVSGHVFGAQFEMDIGRIRRRYEPQSGVLQGSSLGGAIFNYAYWTQLKGWVGEMAVSNRDLIYDSVVTGKKLYMVMTSFVDDVAAAQVGYDARMVLDAMYKGEEKFDHYLDPMGTRQNRSKNVAVADLVGHRSRTLLREAHMAGRLPSYTRYLGAVAEVRHQLQSRGASTSCSGGTSVQGLPHLLG